MRIDAMFTLYPPGAASKQHSKKQQQETLALPPEREREKNFYSTSLRRRRTSKKKYKMKTTQPAQVINYALLFKRLHLEKKEQQELRSSRTITLLFLHFNLKFKMRSYKISQSRFLASSMVLVIKPVGSSSKTKRLL